MGLGSQIGQPVYGNLGNRSVSTGLLGNYSNLIGAKNSFTIPFISKKTTTFPNPQTQVGYDNDLAQEALNYRRKYKATSPQRNVGVFKFKQDGDSKIKPFISNEKNHAEEMGLEYIEKNGIDKNSVEEIFTERQSCIQTGLNPKHNCTLMIQENFPKAKVTYIVEYGDTIESGRNARLELKKLLEENLKKKK